MLGRYHLIIGDKPSFSNNNLIEVYCEILNMQDHWLEPFKVLDTLRKKTLTLTEIKTAAKSQLSKIKDKSDYQTALTFLKLTEEQ